MKTSTKYIALCTAAALLGTACTNLDLNPLDNPSAETWYDDGPKIEMSLNTLLLQQFWPQERYEFTGSGVMDMDEITDDLMGATRWSPSRPEPSPPPMPPRRTCGA